MTGILLRGLTWDHPRGYAPLREAATAYRANGGASVTWDTRSLTAFGDAPLEDVARSYDLLLIDHPHVGQIASSATLRPLNDLLGEDVLGELAQQSAGPSHSSYLFKGQQWALAVDAATQLSAFRPDLYEEALPQAWAQVQEVLSDLARRGLKSVMPLCPTDAICSFLTLYAGHGGRLQDSEDGALTLMPEPAVMALETLRQWAEYLVPESLAMNPIAVYDAMAGADDLAYCPLAFGYSLYTRAAPGRNVLRFANIPTTRGALLGGAGIAVSAYTAHAEEAARFAAWVCSAAVQRGLYTAAGGQPGNRIAWQDASCQAAFPSFFATLETLEHAYMRPRSNGFVAFQTYAGKRIQHFLQTKSALRACLQDLTTALEGRG